MYRNYDGQGSQFGDMSIPIYSPDPDNLSVYAAERTADGVLTLMVINKSWTSQQVSLSLRNANLSGNVRGYHYGRTNWDAIQTLPVKTFANNELVDVFPPQSITLLELR